jgi:hypothetical protein
VCTAGAVGAGYRSVQWKGRKVATLTPEEKFGIKYRSRPGPRTPGQTWSLIIGLVSIVLGIIGFILTGIGTGSLHCCYAEPTDHYIFGLFQWNGFHSTVFIICGLFWLIGAFALTPAGNQGINLALGIIFLILTVLGFLGYWGLLSISPGINGNNLLNLAVAIVSLFVGSGALDGSQKTA